MFCDKCGNSIQQNQRFCSNCGKEVSGPVIGFPRRNRIREHLRLVAILWLAFSAMNALFAVFLYFIANTFLFHLPEMGAPAAMNWLHPFVGVISLVIAAKAALGFVTAWGLLQREPWARILTIVLAFLALFHVPFGTALGVYTLWVLLPAESEAEYHARSQAA